MNKNKTVFGFSLFFCVSGFTLAAPQPAAVDLGGFTMVPAIEIEEKYDSNILFTETDETDSMITILAPSIQIGAQKGVNFYGIQAAAQAGFYTNSSDDNYIDAQLQGDIHQEFTRKSQIDLTALYAKSHEARGTGFSQGSLVGLDEPDEFHTTSAGVDYTYGSEDAIGRIKLSASGLAKRYDNHSATTEGRESNNYGVGATFFYHVQPKTSLLFEIKHNQIDYTLDAVTLDSTENRFLFGAEWEITSITSGNARLGLLKKDFDDGSRDNFSGFSWEIGGVWSPLTYTQFTVQTEGKTAETNGIGDYIDSKILAIGWIHSWTTQISTNLDTFVMKNDYNPSAQEEGIVSISGAVNYDMRRWLTLSVKIGHSQRLSNQAGQDYTKNELSFNILATL